MIKPMDYNTDEKGFALKSRAYNVDTKSRGKSHQKLSDNTDNDSTKFSYKDRESGLCHLLFMQLIFGVTYCGNCPYFDNYRAKKTMFIIYDCVTIVSFALFEWYAFSDDMFTRIFMVTKNKGVLKILFHFAGISLMIEFFSIKGMLLKNGWKLIKAIRHTGSANIARCHTYKIMLFLMIEALFSAIFLPVHFTDFDNSSITKEKYKFVGFVIVGLFYSMNKFSVTSLMLFMANTIQKQIKDWTLNLRTRTIKIQVLCEGIWALRNQLETINDMIGVIMLIKVFANAIFMSTCVCVVSLVGIPVNAIIGIIGFGLISVSDIVSVCYVSQLMINSMADLCKEVEKILILDSGYGDGGRVDYYKQLNIIMSMRESIKLKVLSLFDLKTVTILAIMGYMATPVEYIVDENGFSISNIDLEANGNPTTKALTQRSGTPEKYKCTEAEKRSGLCRLLKIQMAFGVSYCGNCPIFNNYV
ncbi:unnamed protein product, partial [Oppiella nova]